MKLQFEPTSTHNADSVLSLFRVVDRRSKSNTQTHHPLDGAGKLKLGLDMSNKEEPQEVPEQPQVSEEADQIFMKMKETGLIPNAVAMPDGLCKDALVQEAIKLFGSMREKGTIPEVVIYTVVVDGFCKAQKFEDAKRIFRKMQSNGIVPNAFPSSVLLLILDMVLG
ncbi:pentatricopeptide repeat-containing protein At4g38150-like [Malus sylvestris]|uniref:pentatricopeptide repeat-containing protein At4g38150-like n=1 Tax=Malus sylvestris TaxID=3752 RepID=UPI0021ACE8B0|nr:pentatricopeptide repeat-containing protein At4g38150-like [Malus sylvestris]